MFTSGQHYNCFSVASVSQLMRAVTNILGTSANARRSVCGERAGGGGCFELLKECKALQDYSPANSLLGGKCVKDKEGTEQ